MYTVRYFVLETSLWKLSAGYLLSFLLAVGNWLAGSGAPVSNNRTVEYIIDLQAACTPTEQHIRRNRRRIIIGGVEEGVPDGQLSPALHQEGDVQRDDGGPGGGARALCEQLRPRRVVGASAERDGRGSGG